MRVKRIMMPAMAALLALGLTGCAGKAAEPVQTQAAAAEETQREELIFKREASSKTQGIVETKKNAPIQLSARQENAAAVTGTEALPEYMVTPLESSVMHATAAVNVRTGPSTAYKKIGSLKKGQPVEVTGQADTGWYEVVFGEEKAFISDKYLTAQAPEAEPQPPVQPEPQPPVQTPPAPEPAPQEPQQTVPNLIMIGDSRTVDMSNTIGHDACMWIAEYGEGISWFYKTAAKTADPYIGPGTKVIINLGANDPDKIDTYIYVMNEICADWIGRGAAVYYATVGPCNENPFHTNEDAMNFNASLQAGLTAGVQWIDLYGYLATNGFETRENDGLHYSAATYQAIYGYYMGCIG